MLSVNTESQDKGAVESSPKLPDVIDPTVVADSIREHRAILIKAFRHCLPSLADTLCSQSIIPEDAHRKAQKESLDEDERSRTLVSCVEARLEIEPSDFNKFVDILKSEPFFDTLGDKLVHSYCNISSVPAINCPTAFSQYAAYLKGVYRNSPISPDSKWPPTPSKKYIKLATVEHGHKCRDQFIGHTLHGNIEEVLKSRKEISIDNILIPDEGVAYLKLVLIEGAPGIGKSTLAWELCKRWEQNCLEKYSLTVLLRLREKEVQEIRSISELFCSFQSKYKDILLDKISSSNGKRVLFILDGFDELPTMLQKEGFLVNLIRGTFLPECTVLVTSRPSATAELLTICRPQLQKHIEVLGFTLENVIKYATSVFSSEPERLQRFTNFISASPAVNSLMYVPLNAAIIVEIFRHSKSDHFLPHTLTQLYTQLCLTILKRYLQSNPPLIKINKFIDLPGHLYQEFLKLSQVAFDGLRRQEVIFHMPSDLVHFGFLDAVSPLYGGGSISYNFLHLTLQEFFAAYHISQLSGDARLEVLRECGSDEHWNVVWRFVAGLTELKFFEGHLNSDLFVEDNKEDEVCVKPLFIQCLFEANIKMGRSKFFGPKNIAVYTTQNMSHLDYYALGYCIANLSGEVSWNLYIENNDYFIKILITGLKTTNVIYCNNISRLCVRHIWPFSSKLYPLRFIRKMRSTGKYLPLFKSYDYERRDLKRFPYLMSFPLHSITELDLVCFSFISPDHLNIPLLSMTSLKRLNISNCYVHPEFLRALSFTKVTSLNIEDIDVTDAMWVSALQPLIDPLTGTLKELHLGGIFYEKTSAFDYLPPDDDTSSSASSDTLSLGKFDSSSFDDSSSSDDSSPYYDDTKLLDMVCAHSSLKSLTLIQPQNISSLTRLQTNTCLTELKLKYNYVSRVWQLKKPLVSCELSNLPPQLIKVITGILEHNQTLEHLTVGNLELPTEDHILRDIVRVLSRNRSLKGAAISASHRDHNKESGTFSHYMEATYPELCDNRITWTRMPKF